MTMLANSGRFEALTEKVADNDLPTFNSTVRGKHHLSRSYAGAWFLPFALPIPGARGRRLRLYLPSLRRLHQSSAHRFGRRRGTAALLLGITCFLYIFFAVHKRYGTEEKSWPTLLPDSTTLVYRRQDIQKIWQWEVEAGHYPSSHKISDQVGLSRPPNNPALPAQTSVPSRFKGPIMINANGIGPKRIYLDLMSHPPNVAYPPRPVPGSVADMDVIMKHCDFSAGKYVRDCLEVLRHGAGLEAGARVRRGKMNDWKYIYVEESAPNGTNPTHPTEPFALKAQYDNRPVQELTKKRGTEWEPHLHLPAPPKYVPYKDQLEPCDDENPRIFHMFWAGPFTDKPYLALLSFLFTQNLGIHLDSAHPDPMICRPKFWLWINPGPAASVPNPSAVRDMYDQLKSNPWASPFLHPRFKDVIQFKLWNTTEQLDGIPELKDDWRTLRDGLFNSGGYVEKVSQQLDQEETEAEADEVEKGNEVGGAVHGPVPTKLENVEDRITRVGSTSASAYDRLSVILSDMARFVLCHRYGGIYLDADTIFLRDWEELWGWRGAFAYRWSRLPKYNTAVLRMNRGSALGTFLFRTALKNGLDFHPMTITDYIKDAYLEGLLLRLPDALFDSAWLNTESYQRDRPPQPYLQAFLEFFETPVQTSAAPQALGFDGFFRGAYSYHFHNFWWLPFDSSRNFPDLGPRFAAGERIARETLAADSGTKLADLETERIEMDKRDLDWAVVLKRTFEAYVRGERPNMYGEWMKW